jgi:hypothetical protein
MANKWLTHIKKTMRKMKATGKYVAGKGLGQVIKAAKLTWHKAKKAIGQKGGAGSESDSDEEGEMKTVPLDDPPTAATTGTEVDPDSTANIAGRRRRKTRRRRTSRRR